MRASLLHPLAERRHLRRHRSTRPTTPVRPPADLAVRRVREAGGPIDQASYTCQCGFMFAAPVSTTVACPHCGTDQVW